jgi:C1A family cysteine protease
MGKNRSRFQMYFLIGTIGLVASSFGQDAKVAKRAPLNPDFVKYQMERAMNLTPARTADGHTLGEIPGPTEVSPVRPDMDRGLARALPASYDLRTLGKLTSIRDQGGCGSCWAFASLGSLESYLLPAESADYSEQHLIDTAGFYWGPCDGGHIAMSSAYLTRWAGPVGETDDPYNYSSGANLAAVPLKKHVQNVIWYPPRASLSDNDYLKTAVATDGATYVAMWWSDSAFNDTTDSYYYHNSTQTNGGGHAVCIVGWDDNYSASRFSPAAPGNGAFIVRNSWGTSWGENGYFYVSYYDTFFARRWYNGGIRAEATNNYGGLFQYDPLGWVSNWGWGSPEATGWGANIFTAPVKSTVSAVGFQTVSSNCSYEIYVYTGVVAGKPRSGSLKASTAGSVTFPGFYTIALPNSVSVAAAQKFSVVVKFTTPGYYYPIATEDKEANYADIATAAKGQSFIDLTGSIGKAWQDISADTASKSNCCIKAYTVMPAGIKIVDPAVGRKWIRGTTHTINWTVSGSMASTVKIQLYKGTAKVSDIAAVTDNDGTFDWAIPLSTAKAADFSIKITTTDGKYKGTSGKFSVTGSTIQVTAPSSGTAWKKGATQTITWVSAGPQSSLVRIQVLRNGTLVKEIGGNLPNSGSFGWSIPTNLVTGTGYKIRVNTMDNQVKGDSGSFSLIN